MPSNICNINHLHKYNLISIAISLVLGFLFSFFTFNDANYLYSYFSKILLLNTIMYSSYFFLPNFATWLLVYFSLDFYKQVDYKNRLPLLSMVIKYVLFISMIAGFIYLVFFPFIDQKLLEAKRNSQIARECLNEVVENYNSKNYETALNALNIYMSIDKKLNARFNIVRKPESKISLLDIIIPLYKKKSVDEFALNSNNIKTEIEYALKENKKEKGDAVPNSIKYFAEKKYAYDVYSKGSAHNDADALLEAYKLFKKLSNYNWFDIEIENKIIEIEKKLRNNTFFLDELLGFDKFPVATNLLFYNIDKPDFKQKIEIGKLIILKNNTIMMDIKITEYKNDKVSSILYSNYGKLIKNRIYFTAIDRKKIDSVNTITIEKPGETKKIETSINTSVELFISPKIILSLQDNKLDLSNLNFIDLITAVKYTKNSKSFSLNFYKEIFIRITFLELIFIYFFLAMIVGIRTAPRKLNVNVAINKLYTPFIFILMASFGLIFTIFARTIITFMLMSLSIATVSVILLSIYLIIILLIFLITVISIKRRIY